ncbi:hypothetical protein N8D56_19775 [Devosia sp. A8/3-2]|nr:hypothetical protein N8D56_19775 [Devosia sp. A8/3-2]
MKFLARAASAACPAAAIPGPAAAQSTIRSLPTQDHIIDSYIAQIGYHDLHNSSGARLTNPWQVLRQDRANYHRYGLRDPYDQDDIFFGSEGNRATMESMLSMGSISPQAAHDILSGNALVLVEIHGTGSTGRGLHVTVAR